MKSRRSAQPCSQSPRDALGLERPAEDEIRRTRNATQAMLSRRERTDMLRHLEIMLAKAGPGIRFNEHMEGDGETLFRQACKPGLYRVEAVGYAVTGGRG